MRSRGHVSISLDYFTDMKVGLLVTLLLGASSGWPMFPLMLGNLGMWPPMQRVYNFFFLPFHYQPPTTIATTTTTSTISTTTTTMTSTTTTSTTTTPTTTTTSLPPEIEVIVLNAIEKMPVSTAKVTVKDRENKTVADQVPVKEDGKALIELEHQGIHKVYVEADGFIDSEDEVDVQCNDENCKNPALVALSPELPPGQTRIMMTWVRDPPQDIDLHLVGFGPREDQCLQYYDYIYKPEKGCNGTVLNIDQKTGPGVETITLTDTYVNKDFIYLIGIVDWTFATNRESDGTPFLKSGASITITNGPGMSIFRKLPEEFDASATITSEKA